MIIRSLAVSNYRNYKEEIFYFEPGTNVFYGNNAQGKTNALEAIFMCATGKSHKGTKEKDIINFESGEAHIKVIIEKDGVPHRVDMHLKKGGRKGIAIDGVPLKKAVELFGMVHVVSFAPEDISIIKASPIERRNFIDISLCQLDKVYTQYLINYNKTVIQKNKLLKSLDEDPSYRDTIFAWNNQLVNFGRPIIEKRKEFISELSEIIKEIHYQITDGKEELSIIYTPSVDEDFERVLEEKGFREEAARMALYGPHRDDIRFEINGVDVRNFGSQGQQRTAALSLKLSEIEIIKRRVNDTPVLLLDDVLSELDEGRQQRLLSGIDGVQVIVTCTGLDEFLDSRLKIDKTFFIDSGKVSDAR